MTIHIKHFLIFIGIITGIFLIASCHKDEEITHTPYAKLNFSTDSILFDTVFTSVGSTIRRFKVFNYGKKAINIDDIRIEGGNTSPFSMNVNGKQMVEGQNIKISGTDSINILVRVNINPTTENQPFIVEDAIVLSFNGKQERMPLAAYGQNAIFIDNGSISTPTVWDSQLPYIIRNTLTVEDNATLTISKGTRILFHKEATMHIKGTLIANGTKQDSILFASDRMERIYEEEPGQWNGIHFHENSSNSVINHATIKNAIVGITVGSPSSTQPKNITIANSVIKNMQIAGFLGYYTHLSAYNNLFYNCGQYLLYGIGGGNYDLVQNTFAAYNFNFVRRTPAIYLSDYINTNQYATLEATFTNNIIWGSLDDELAIEEKSGLPANIAITNNLIKTKQTSFANGNILNQDPLFINARQGNFRLDENSMANNQGVDLSSHPYFNLYLTKDILEKERLFPSELGCYENN